MKRCPECRRVYYDESMLFCLDDGASLLEGPASLDESKTEILNSKFDNLPTKVFPSPESERATKLQSSETEETAISATDKIGKSGNLLPKKALLIFVIIGTLGLAGFLGFKYFTPSKQIESIAVMPFTNESGNSEIDYLSDGMTETLISNISRLPNLNVRPRSSVFRYKGKEFDAKKIAAELNVDAILTGTVKRNGNDIFLTVELIDPKTDKLLWKGDYSRTTANLPELQSQIALDVSSKVKSKLSSTEEKQLTKTLTSNPEAYQRYLQGRFLLNGRATDIKGAAVEHFNKAIELDPGFAAAYAGLADAYTLLGTTTRAKMTPQESMPKAKEAAQKAVELDPLSSEAYTSLGWIKFRFDWDWPGAEAAFKKAVELNPKNAQAHHWFGEFLYAMRRYEDSVSELRIAAELEPFSAEIRWNYGKNLFMAGKYEESLIELNKVREVNDSDWRTFTFIYLSSKKLGRTKEAYEALKRSRELQESYSSEELAEVDRIYAEKGLDAAHKKFAEFRLVKAEKNGSNSYTRATAYLESGDKQRALDLLEEAYKEKFGAMVNIYAQDLFSVLREEPRYKELVRKMNFPVN